VKFELGVQRVDLEREERKAHQLSHRFLDADLIGEEWHVGDNERVLGAACDRARVVDHRIERHRERVRVAEDD